ncbi:cytoskeleton-associated protein 5-like [Eublepharis macularius]|uniref:Cytoskeleton-associated protein 5-like n=1 Tax=Eublepharis macularius TaxID=481883 RepID=A0AA97JK29_EUBMA|nr:cytoskeleton-associated protein 5-like [Eublepharis macularius]
MLDPRNLPEKELSEETCELEAAAVLPASCLQHLDSSDWKERISCMEAFEKAVEKMEENQVPCQALVRLLDKEPGWKETKLQVMQKKLQLVTLIAQKGVFSKTSAQFVLGNLVDKIGDVICGGDTKEALTAVAEACGLPWTAGKVTEVAFSQDSPRTHSETLNWLASAIRDFGFEGMEAEAFIKHMKSALAAAHPDVRASAFNLLGVMYLCVGAPLRAFFEDEKPLLLSQIDAEIEKVKGKSLPPPTRGRCKFCRENGNEQRGGDAQLCTRNSAVDISKRFSTELMHKMQDSGWKVRREGLEELSRILSDVKSIQPSIGDLPAALKICLHDSNKALVKQTLGILQQLARLMGPGIKYHIKTLGIPLIAVFRDSKGSVRAVALKTVEAWAEQTGMKEWLDEEDLSAELKKENFPQRQGILGWLADKLPCPSSASTDLVRCLPHLYSSLEDRQEETCKAAHEALPFFLLHLGFEKMSEAAGKLKPASRDQVLLVLENTKAGWPAKPTTPLDNSPSELPRSKPWPKLAPPQHSNPASFSAENVGSTELNLDAKKTKPEGTVPKAKKMPGVKTKYGMKEDSSKVGPIFIIVPKAKEQRMKDEKALKVLRWNFSTPSSKYVEQLKAQMSGCLSNCLQEELFHSNFQHHIKALTMMTKHLETEKDGVISCLDLVLKWLTLRLFDTNTWVLMKSLEYLKKLFDLLIQENYQLMENEASSFLPYLLLKMGATKESILKEVRAIVKQTILIYPVSKTFYFLLEGAKGKNPNQRVGCLEELGWLLKEYGPDVGQPSPSKALKTIIALTGDSNNSVHSAALRVVATARDVYGSEAFKAIAGVSEKHMNLLEDGVREVEARRVKEEKVYTQVSNMSTRAGLEGCRRSHAISNRTGEEYSTLHQDRTETGNAGSMALGQSPNLGSNAPRATSLESQTGSSINMIICHVASGNISTSTEALAEIQEILRREDKVRTMSGHINQFLIATLRQLKFIHRLHVTAEEETEKEEVAKLYSSVICSMVSLFQVDGLAQEASTGVLKDLMNILITLLLDSPVEELQEGQEVTQFVNLLMTKVLERSDQTRILSSLLDLLCECLTASTCPLPFSEVVAKCLWKTSRLLPQTIGSINLDQILLDIHIFMKALPEEKLKQSQSSIPLRALKTLLHTFCKLKGEEILDHLSLIQDKGESELEAYLRKFVGHSAKQNGVDGDTECSLPAEGKIENTLGSIFKKINCKETARAGLEELYEYKKENPEADLEPFLKTCSLLFRSYVKHGLAVIGSERGGKQNS